MTSDPRERRELIRVYGPVVVVVLIAFVVAFQFIKPAPPDHITLATGGPQGAYHAFGERYRALLAEHGVDVVLRPTAGSAENLALLRSGEADVAFVQGGSVAPGEAGRLRALGSLYFEPLWLFHQADRPVQRLGDLRGLRIAAGADGSGTRQLVLQLLDANGVSAAAVDLRPLGGRAAAAALQAGDVDVVLLVSGASSPAVQRLVAMPGVRLAGFDRAPAYARRFRFLSELSLPQGSLDLAANLPPQDLTLVAPTAALVGGPELHPAIADLLLQAATRIHGAGGTFEAVDQFPSPAFTELPLNKEADRYYQYGPPLLQRFLPFWLASLVDRLKVMLLPLLVLLLPLAKIMPPIYSWRMRSRVFRWYRELERIDLALHDGEDKDALRDDLDRLEREVLQVEVPLSFANQLYHLRQHIDLVRARVDGNPRGIVRSD